MMPPEQEATITGSGTPAVIMHNRTETVSVHAELSVSSINLSLRSQDKEPAQHEPKPNPARFSILRESLHPVTLKVRLLACTV